MQLTLKAQTQIDLKEVKVLLRETEAAHLQLETQK
jgi:hypothetical protein